MDKIPDSQWLASMVVAAYSEERYDLGLALARLQSQAVRIERDRAFLPAVPVTPCCNDCIERCTGSCALCHNKVPATVVDAAVYAPEHAHVQEREQATGEATTDLAWMVAPVDVCQDCGTAIRWSIKHQLWSHIDGEGRAVASPAPAHDGRPAPAVNEEAPAPAAEEAPTVVTPSARCIAIVGTLGKQRECHGVLYWVEAAMATSDGMQAGWVHLDSYRSHGHDPIADRPVQR